MREYTEKEKTSQQHFLKNYKIFFVLFPVLFLVYILSGHCASGTTTIHQK
jgi:hypothetical protein